MYIIGLIFVLFFVGCGANMNSFNINVEGTVDYSNNNSNNNTNTSGNTNTGGNTGTNTGSNTGGNTGTNTGSSTGGNTGSNVNITEGIGAQLSTKTALEVSSGTGIPVTGGASIEVQVYQNYQIMKYTTTLTKVRYSNNVSSISTEGIVNNDMARIPIGNNFIKIYFNQDGDSVSKIFEISATTSGTLPSS